VFATTLGVGLIFGFEPPLIAFTLSRAGSSSFAIGAVTAMSLVAVIVIGPYTPSSLRDWVSKRSIVTGIGIAVLILLLMRFGPVLRCGCCSGSERLCARADVDCERDIG